MRQLLICALLLWPPALAMAQPDAARPAPRPRCARSSSATTPPTAVTTSTSTQRLRAQLTQWFPSGRVDLPSYEAQWRSDIGSGNRVEGVVISDLRIQVGPSADAAVATYLLRVTTRSAKGAVETEDNQETDVLFKRDGDRALNYAPATPELRAPAQARPALQRTLHRTSTRHQLTFPRPPRLPERLDAEEDVVAEHERGDQLDDDCRAHELAAEGGRHGAAEAAEEPDQGDGDGGVHGVPPRRLPARHVGQGGQYDAEERRDERGDAGPARQPVTGQAEDHEGDADEAGGGRHGVILAGRARCGWPPGRHPLRPGVGDLPGTICASAAAPALVRRVCGYGSASTVFRSVPMPSMVHVERSPGLKYTGVARAVPTPAGLPVEMRSPGRSVIICDAYSTSS